jgi:hypothetical protein
LNRYQGRDKDRSVDNLNGKLDRLGLWPEGDDGNGHNEDDGINYWKGKRIISMEEWKRIAGYTDLNDVLNPEEREELTERLKCKCGDLEQERKDMSRVSEILDRATPQIKREINPEALQYFPEADPNKGYISFPFDCLDSESESNSNSVSHYHCFKAPDLYMTWILDYRELFIHNGFREHQYSPTAF